MVIRARSGAAVPLETGADRTVRVGWRAFSGHGVVRDLVHGGRIGEAESSAPGNRGEEAAVDPVWTRGDGDDVTPRRIDEDKGLGDQRGSGFRR